MFYFVKCSWTNFILNLIYKWQITKKKKQKITKITDENRQKKKKRIYRHQLYIKKKQNMNEADTKKLRSQWRTSYERKKMRSVEHIEHMQFQMKNYSCNVQIGKDRIDIICNCFKHVK